MRKACINGILWASLTYSLAYQTPGERLNSVAASSSRRKILRTTIASAVAVASLKTKVCSSFALGNQEDTQMIDVYFGCGCFWHVQHEMVEAERRILKRNDETLSARVGYAGGTRIFKNNPKSVCYPNALNAWYGDYRKIGYAEVVSLRIPPSTLSEFVMEYIALFDQDGNRPDQVQDVGSPYRNLIGIPGGSDSNSPYYKEVIKALNSMKNKNIQFVDGKGYDNDVKGVSFVMDTAGFPFVVGEKYHQFHDGFMKGEDYPDSYNNIVKTLIQKGTLEKSICPNGALGFGIGGL